MFRNQQSSSGRKIQVPGKTGTSELRVNIPESRTNNDPIFSPIYPNPLQHPPVKSGYLDLHSSGNQTASPTRLYCVLSHHSLRCYANNPADMGSPADNMVPLYDLRVRDYALTSTQSRRPQAFALLNNNKTSKIEFVCKNIGAMNQWTAIFKVSNHSSTGNLVDFLLLFYFVYILCSCTSLSGFHSTILSLTHPPTHPFTYRPLAIICRPKPISRVQLTQT
jgi:hypothetical protein